jgi:hypothetical protein
MTHDHVVNGHVLTLVQPNHIGVKWTQKNKIFRSSVWDSEGNLVSAGFPKFTNFGESPEEFPVPSSLTNTVIVEKLDGSLLIVSKYKGEFIYRTRGTVDARPLNNGHEIAIIQKQLNESGFIAHYNDVCGETWNRSFLFEWTSPNQKIVINYGDTPTFKLIGIVSHHDYSLESQTVLDEIAVEWNFDRPDTFTFGSVSALLAEIEQWKGQEGVVIYSKNGQALHKVKTPEYLKLHSFRSNATFENTVELFFAFDMPLYSNFEQQLVTKFDYECFNMIKGFISNICDGYKEVLELVSGMKNFASKVKKLPTRKEQAMAIFSSYGKESNRSSYVFSLLDGKELTKDQLKKLLYQITKK